MGVLDQGMWVGEGHGSWKALFFSNHYFQLELFSPLGSYFCICQILNGFSCHQAPDNPSAGSLITRQIWIEPVSNPVLRSSLSGEFPNAPLLLTSGSHIE